MQAELSVYRAPEQLRSQLLQTIGRRQPRRALVGISTDQFTTSAAAGSDVSEEEAASRPGIRLGCLVKLLTATLVLDAQAHGLIDLNATLLESLPAVGRYLSTAGTIRLRHLLEHTHGIDDSMLDVRQPATDDQVGLESLCRQLEGVPALNRPGQLYSYSHVGSLLLAAILAHRCGRSFADLLTERLLGPLDIPLQLQDRSEGANASAPLSPCFEGQRALGAADLMRLIGYCARISFREPPGSVAALPGWSAVERGVCLGWKAYGDGWFGHASDLREHLTIVKVHPPSGTVLLASSSDLAPSTLMGGVFRPILPRSHELQFPRLLGTQERGSVDLAAYGEAYENAALGVALSASERGGLHIDVRRRGEPGAEGAFASRALPAREHLFVCERAAGDFAVFQFVQPEPSADQYLWNGRNILRRVT